MKKGKFAIIGLGQFGRAIAKTLAQRGSQVLAIDLDERLIDEIGDSVAEAVAIDATDKKALMSLDIASFDAVVVAIGENFEQLLLVTSHLLDIGVNRVISRACGDIQKLILQKIGVKEILLPEDEVGIIVAEKLLNPTIVSYLDLPEEFCIMEVSCPPGIAGRTLADIQMRSKYHVNLITIKRAHGNEVNGAAKKMSFIIGIPHGSTLVEIDDYLVLFGRRADVERFIHVNN